MSFVKPMLCRQYRGILPTGSWIAEEKFDGHRMIVEVARPEVSAWSRAGNKRVLPRHILADLARLPRGVYDGELICPGKHSANVVEIAEQDNLLLVLFDVISLCGSDMTGRTYVERAAILQKGIVSVFSPVRPPSLKMIEIKADVDRLCAEVWARGGEGLVLKRTDSRYESGKRCSGWLKVKQCLSADLTIVGFTGGELGARSIVLLRDDEGHETSVKVLDHNELEFVESVPMNDLIGRRLTIEYQERTPDGAYRHPRWDRWSDR